VGRGGKTPKRKKIENFGKAQAYIPFLVLRKNVILIIHMIYLVNIFFLKHKTNKNLLIWCILLEKFPTLRKRTLS